MRRLKLYLRISLILVVAGGIALVLIMNRNHAAPVWFLWLTDVQRPVNVVWLMLCSSAATLIAWWTISASRGLLRDMRELRRAEEAQRLAASQTQRETEFRERERRIDEKLRQMETPRADEPRDPEI
jgi:hypothetical protein